MIRKPAKKNARRKQVTNHRCLLNNARFLLLTLVSPSLRMIRVIGFIIPVLVVLHSASAVSSAATFIVNTTADTQDAAPGNGLCADSGGLCSLRAAITEANALAGADTITLPAGTYTQALVAPNEDANAGGDLDITSSININGAGSESSIVQANALFDVAAERVFHVVSATAIEVTIDGLTVQNGVAPVAPDGGRGGGIKVGDNQPVDANINFTLTNSVVRYNHAGTRGGGLAINKARSVIDNCFFSDNVAGGSDPAGTSGAGGAVLIDSQDNASIPTMTSLISNTTMNGNLAESYVSNTFGGALIVRAVDAVVTISNCTVNNNMSASRTNGSFSGFAGGLYNQQAHMIVLNSVVNTNTASEFHPGIRTLASTGAAATLDVSNTTISNNTSTYDISQGGGITNIVGGTFDATLNITASTVSGNTLPGNQSFGGGLLNTGNTGGSAILNVINSTISGNSATFAGGVYNDGTAATVRMNYCTVASNAALAGGEGGGILQDTTTGGATLIKNSVVADNSAPFFPDIDGVITSSDYNLIENVTGTGYAPAAHDQVSIDPQLQALGFYGGLTRTHYPGSNSPVIDTIPAGSSDCAIVVSNDQ
jgi:CSLREA domain-containing protein